MTSTSSTRAGRIWKFSAIVIPMQIVDDTGTDATVAAVAGIGDPGPRAICHFSNEQKVSTFFTIPIKIDAPRGGSTMRNSKTALACVVKEHLNRGAFYLVLLIGICLIPFTLAQRTTRRAPANIITVTNLNDSGSGSLRQALADANDGDTIEFAVTGTISLTSGELVIDKNIIISGPGPALLTVARSQQAADFRIFNIPPSHTAEIDGLTITGGSLVANGGRISSGV